MLNPQVISKSSYNTDREALVGLSQNLKSFSDLKTIMLNFQGLVLEMKS